MRVSCLAVAVLVACHGQPVPDPAASHDPVAPDPWASPGSASATGSDVPQESNPRWVSDAPRVLRDKINGVNAHVVVLKTQSSFPEYREVLATVEKTPGVVAAEPFIFAELFIASDKHAPVAVSLKAVDPSRVGNVLALPAHMKEGQVSSLAARQPPAIILGDDLAKALGVKIGDDVTLTPAANASFAPKVFRVTGSFHTDFDEYDERLGYASLSAVQSMLGRGDQVMGVELAVKDVDRAQDVAHAIDTALGGPPFVVMDWYELNKQLFTKLYGDRRP